MSTAKIQTLNVLSSRVRALREAGVRIVFTNGCFDVLHPGHAALLEAARREGDVLIAAINSDESIRRLKGEGRPIFPEDERAEVLAALAAVDFVCIFEEDTPRETILALKPDVLVKGADWVDAGIVGREEVEGWGGRVVAVQLTPGQSSTAILERVTSRLAP